MPAPPFDWFSAVIVPLIIAVFTGIPLAIYTGVVSGRYLLFHSTKQQAKAKVIDCVMLVEPVVVAATDVLASRIYAWPLRAMMLSFSEEQSQLLAANQLLAADKLLQSSFMGLRAQVAAAKTAGAGSGTIVTSGFFKDQEAAMKIVAAVEPDYFALFLIPNPGIRSLSDHNRVL